MPSNQTTGNESVARPYLYDVFLSHHSSDKPQVEIIAARLEDEAGLKPFLDKWHLVPGEAWEEELEEALDRSATCAVFLGPSALGAWHNEEMRAALDERVRNKSFRVVPILLPGAEPKDKSTLPRFLRRLTWVDFRAGLGDQEAFHRLVAGIKGLPPGRQASSLNSAPSPSQSLNRVSVAGEGETAQDGLKEKQPRTEMWKIVAGAVLALLLSTSFIGAAIPRYKLQIKSPAFKNEGVYEAPEGTVTVKWAMLKEQWFREVDVGGVNANVTIRKLGDDENEKAFPNSMGEVNTKLRPGKYEVRIDAVEHQRSETIALEISASGPTLEILTGTVVDRNDRPVQGARVTIDEVPGMIPVETSSDGVFSIDAVPRKDGEGVRIRVVKEGYQPNPYTEDVVLGKAPPRIRLTRAK
jgi:hypothetical protein